MCPTRAGRLRVLAGALLFVACASAPKTPTSPPRMKDSASDRVAAQRAAAPHGVPLEQDDERWGIEAARERKRQQDAAKARRPQDTADKAVGVTR